ncbi:Hypothetical predicted protein [Mytilus galloprovincialis]|uniref:Uncharacterized protein n=1 Tax=Mytilus galloprovincialis TaxID=29158 RepID=A0A8B6DMX0_MYTGA|nr:Hypothetical predicted protein [Mytilus galloprovincialis]
MTIKQNISKIDVQLYQIKEYCSERQAFFFVHNIVKSITKADKTFRTSLSDMKTLSLYYKSGETFNFQGYEVEKLEIVLNSEPYIFNSAKQSAKTKQAQVPISVISIDKISLSKAITFHLKYRVIQCFKVVCLSDKVIIVNNTAMGLLIYSIMGSLEREIEYLHGDIQGLKEPQNRNSRLKVKDITVISKDCIAVMRKNDILNVNVENGYVKSISNSRNMYFCRRLCYCKDFLYLTDCNGKITVMDLAGNIVKTINYEKSFHDSIILSYVVQNNKIFILSKVLICLDLNGQLLWQAKTDEHFVKTHTQMSVDNFGNCYIPSAVSNNIKVISNNGKQSNLLLSVTDGIRYPRAVYFDTTNNRLIVMTLYGICTVFDVNFRD